MKALRFTLVADGQSDEVLVPILTWLLSRCRIAIPVEPSFADFRYLRSPPRGLVDRIEQAVRLYDCDLLFVHRDAEAEPPASRFLEIRNAEETVSRQRELPPVVGVVPVRMTEAFLLFDERAIRRAAGNPNGKIDLALPPLKHCESIPDPKAVLHGALRTASELVGRRLKKYSVADGSRRIVELIEDFEPLLELSAIRTLEADISAMVRDRGWSVAPD
jgi:hypothetical protein